MWSIGISFPVQSLNAAAPWNSIIPSPFIVLHPASFAILRIFVSSGEYGTSTTISSRRKKGLLNNKQPL